LSCSSFEVDRHGLRTIWLTITRSAPLMMKVPRSVHQGKFPDEHFLFLDLSGFLVPPAGR